MSSGVGFVGGERLRLIRVRQETEREDDFVLRAYRRETYAGVSKLEMRELFADARAGDIRAAGRLVVLHNGLVEKYARRVWAHLTAQIRQSLSLDDLKQEARGGLLKAIERYDPGHVSGARFSTFATWWIRERLQRFIDDYASAVRVPVHRLDKYRAEKKHRSVLLRTSVREAIEMAMCYVDVDGVELAAEEAGEPDDTLRHVKRAIVALARAGDLSPREVEVLARRYMPASGDGETILAIGDSIGVTRERIRQVEEKALAKVRREVLRREEKARRALAGPVLAPPQLIQAPASTEPPAPLEHGRRSRLGEDGVRALRAEKARVVPVAALMKKYGISYGHLYALCRGVVRDGRTRRERPTDAEVAEIRASKLTTTQAERKYALSRGTISRIKLGKRVLVEKTEASPAKRRGAPPSLSDADIRAIRAEKTTRTAAQLAKRFGVSSSSIYAIWSGRRYGSVGEG